MCFYSPYVYKEEEEENDGDDERENSSSERIEQPRTGGVWMGWPAFDMRFCKFEVEQWLSACNIDRHNFDYQNDDWETQYLLEEAVYRAQETIEKILCNGESEG